MNPIEKHEIPHEFMEQLGNIKNMKFPRQGYTSDVGIVESSNGIFAIKRTKNERFSQWLNREVYILKTLSQTELPIPKVYGFIEQKENNQTWALFQYIQGKTLRSALFQEENEEKRYELIKNFGQILNKIHTSTCPIEFKNKKIHWIDSMLLEAQYNLENYETEGSIELLNKLKENKPKCIKQTLIHGDFTIDNVIVQGTNISGIIDWDGGSYGDPRYDVSLAIRPKPNAFQNKEEIDTFFEGYGERIIDENDSKYFGNNGLYAFF